MKDEQNAETEIHPSSFILHPFNVDIFDDVAGDWSPRLQSLTEQAACAAAVDLLATYIFCAVRVCNSSGTLCRVWQRSKYSDFARRYLQPVLPS